MLKTTILIAVLSGGGYVAYRHGVAEPDYRAQCNSVSLKLSACETPATKVEHDYRVALCVNELKHGKPKDRDDQLAAMQALIDTPCPTKRRK